MKTFTTLDTALAYVTGRGWGVDWINGTGYVYNMRGYLGELLHKGGDWAFVLVDM